MPLSDANGLVKQPKTTIVTWKMNRRARRQRVPSQVQKYLPILSSSEPWVWTRVPSHNLPWPGRWEPGLVSPELLPSPGLPTCTQWENKLPILSLSLSPCVLHTSYKLSPHGNIRIVSLDKAAWTDPWCVLFTETLRLQKTLLSYRPRSLHSIF